MKREDFDEGPGANIYHDSSDEDEDEPLRPVWKCWDCDVTFPGKVILYDHLLYHIKQPVVELDIIPKLERISSPLPPLKITLKTNGNRNSFEIVTPTTSPSSSDPGCRSNSLDEVSTEADEFEGKLEETYEEDFYKIDEVNDELEIKDQVGGSPFADDEVEGENSQSSISGSAHSLENLQEENDEHSRVNFSPNLAEVIGGAFLADINSPIPFAESPSAEEEPQDSPKEDKYNSDQASENNNDNTAEVATLSNGNHANSHHSYGGIPGAEPTPPPEPSPTGSTEYPKIKIKTTGLFKDPEPRGCTITEITDDNPSGDSSQNNSAPIWTTPSLDDPLKLPDSDSLLSMFNERNNKDLGYSSNSDNEFISLDTFNERNRNQSMQLYNPNNAAAASSSLQSLTGLPMQALAQQVSRLNPGGGQGLHQQNVLINIQQFPSQPQAPYPPQQHQHYPHYPPPHPGQPNMHQPYQYQPPNSMYPPYPAPGFPPQHPQQPHMQPPPQHQMGQMQPPQHQMGQMQQQMPMGQQPAGPRGGPGQQQQNSMGQSSQGQAMPPPNQIPQPPNNMQGGYRPPMAPNARPQHARGTQPGGVRMPGANPRPPMNQRAPGMRARAPMVRPRGAGGIPPRGQMRPRMGAPQNGLRPGQPKPLLKRNPDQNNAALQAKRKKVEVLTPSDKEDDDCQVIFTQPKNTGLPQIEHIQGASEAVDNTIMKLPDSITLSVRPPAPKSASSPQKSEAKAVANVLASRGITVTPSAKPKETPKQASPTAMSLNGAVSIVAASKGGAKPADGLPTVDLTDDSPSDAANRNRPGLPYRCDLCPATYPNSMGLNKHRQTYHKTTSGMSELGVPLVNLKQPGIMQKLSQMGINNYIPMPSAGAGGTYAIPIINTKNPGSLVSALDSTQMLTLGPVRTIPRPGVSNNTNNAGKK